MPTLLAEPRVPSRDRLVEAGRLKVTSEEQELECISERNLGQLGRERPSQNDVPTLQGSLELA
jgi:hypothetical protein